MLELKNDIERINEEKNQILKEKSNNDDKIKNDYQLKNKFLNIDKVNKIFL